MSRLEGLTGRPFEPDVPGLLKNLLREGTPARAYNFELSMDVEIRQAIADRFNLMAGVSKNDPYYEHKRLIAVNRFCGFDFIVAGLVDLPMQLIGHPIEDTAELKKAGGRRFMEEHRGPITSWEEFEKFPWPNPRLPSATRDLETYSRLLPEDMCIVGIMGHFAEELTWLMGYETLCYALFDQRDLVRAIAERLFEHYRVVTERLLQFDRVKVVFATDDMGYKTGLMISAKDLREFVLPGHKICADLAHKAGRPYLLHSCGKLAEIIPDLIDDVKIDAKHSFEDTIEDVRGAKQTYGKQITLLGGLDVDFLCRSDEAAIRRRVRQTLDACMPGGGYCLGTGNTVANYIPVDHYLAMLDEGRLY